VLVISKAVKSKARISRQGAQGVVSEPVQGVRKRSACLICGNIVRPVCSSMWNVQSFNSSKFV
jgi:hypothetical protein